jgi:hypothetical protein
MLYLYKSPLLMEGYEIVRKRKKNKASGVQLKLTLLLSKLLTQTSG